MNFRFALCLAVAMIVSTIFASCLFVSQKSKICFIVVLFVVFAITALCFAIFKRKFLVVVLSVLFAGIIPVVSIYFKAETLNKNNSIISEDCSYVGKIFSLSKNLDKNAIFIELDDVYIVNGEDKSSFSGMIYVRLGADGVDTSKLEIGKVISIYNAKTYGYTLCETTSENDRSNISRGVNAISFAYAHNLKIEDEKRVGFRDKIKQKVYENFEETDTFFTNIGYAMIFGESSVLNDEVYDIFKDSGIAHLLAVSGFHVSVIVAVLMFLLNKTKANKYLKFLIIATILTFYAYLCSFSVSVIRASIMSLLLIYSSNRCKEYDKLSALSLAACLILIVSPMQLFNLSFVFSFVSILSIILLMPIFERLLNKIFTEKMAAATSVSVAVSFGISIFQLYYFGKFPVLSIVSNVIAIPVISVLFVFLLISVILGPIFSVAVPLIKFFGYCMKYVVQFNGVISKSGLFISCGEFACVAMLLSVLIMFVVSDYLFASKKVKVLSIIPLVAALFLVMI